ncbi:MAG TPA: tRNA (guanosine(46)-N7)-methyltransferase TrmB [Burkholderiales bacterium]|nr:tRNA (guanosine(46)-N7)-methyltransferase TrmB [Burkholderiales bacterium]
MPARPRMPEAERRSIRSYVLRQGRVTAAQANAVERLMPIYGIAFSPAPLDLDAAFGRRAAKILEIGFGMGETTVAIAQAHPESDYLGIEVHTPGVGALLRRIESLGLANVRVIQHDAVEVVEKMIAPAALDGVHVFFPDPWPKKRHHKRRLLQPAFVHLLAARLKPGAYLHAATDWEDYAVQMLDVLSAEPLLANTATGFAPRPESRPLTKFETRGTRLGHGVWDLLFLRR